MGNLPPARKSLFNCLQTGIHYSHVWRQVPPSTTDGRIPTAPKLRESGMNEGVHLAQATGICSVFTKASSAKCARIIKKRPKDFVSGMEWSDHFRAHSNNFLNFGTQTSAEQFFYL